MTHAYEIDEFAADEKLTVFAESLDQAVTIFVTYRMMLGFTEPESFAVGRAARGIKDQRQRDHMRVALLRREIGLGTYDSEDGWRVVPVIDAADDRPAGLFDL